MSVEAPNKTQSLIIDELNSFYKLYFSHPWWAGKASGRLRLIFLPSAWLIEKSEAMGVRVGPKEFETRFQFGESGEITSTTEYINGRIIGASDRGYDCYYFLNAVRAEKYGEQKFFGNEDIERVLFLPLDIDVEKIESFGDLGEVEERAAWVIETGGFRGNRHVVVAVDQDSGTGSGTGSGRIGELGALCAEFCAHFGSDPIKDAKRILRLPGTINWKRGGDAASDVGSRARMARSDLNYEVFGEEEVRAMLGRYAGAVRVKTARIKTGIEDEEESGEGYGHWSVVLEAGEAGKWAFEEDDKARHRALLIWGEQMLHDELNDRDINKNMWRLAALAFKDGFALEGKERQRDLGNLIHSTLTKRAPKVRADIEARDRAFLGDVVIEGEMKEEALEAVVLVAPDKREKLVVLNEDLVSFAHRLAARWPDEDQEKYLKWLMDVGFKVNRALMKDKGVFEPACGALVARLKEYQMARGGDLVVPRWKLGEILRPQCLNDDELRAFLVEYISAVALKVYANRKKIAALPDAAVIGGKKARVFFQCKASVLSALVNGVAGKILLGGIEDVRNSGIVVFQNGLFELGEAAFVQDENAGREKWWAQARWLHNNPIAHRFDEKGAAVELNGSALLGMKMLRGYLEDTFVGDENRLTREELIPRIIGYCMIRGNPGQKFFTFIGPGGSGKGVLCEIIEALVGDWNAARVNYSCLAAPWGFAPLEGKLVCVADEAESATRKTHDEVMSRIKAYTGSENFAMRGMREVERTVETTAKILITCNKDLAANDSGGALARRMVCLSFDNVRGVGAQKPNLGKRIVEAEGDKIASWAVARLAAALRSCEFNALFEVGGAGALEKGKERVGEMIDPLANFIEGCVERVDGANVNSSVFLEVLGILIDMERMRHPGGQIGTALKGAMERAGIGRKDGQGPRQYLNCQINITNVLEKYEVDKESFARAVRSGPLGVSGSIALGLEEDEEENGSNQSEIKWGR